jgi:hypothetical protein
VLGRLVECSGRSENAELRWRERIVRGREPRAARELLKPLVELAQHFAAYTVPGRSIACGC